MDRGTESRAVSTYTVLYVCTAASYSIEVSRLASIYSAHMYAYQPDMSVQHIYVCIYKLTRYPASTHIVYLCEYKQAFICIFIYS